MSSYIIRDFSFTTAIGDKAEQVLRALDAGSMPPLKEVEVLGQARRAAVVPVELPDIEEEVFNTGTNRLLRACLQQLSPAWKDIAPERLGVIIGTSNAGIEEFHWAWGRGGVQESDLQLLEMGGPALFLAKETGALGPAYCISTACSSSAKALASAARLLDSGICDAVIAGGGDELCRYTLAGFEALHLLSGERATPFCEPFAGVNHGEAAALFLLQKGEAKAGDILLSGYGESSDAHHPTTPEPSGKMAAETMHQALAMAGLTPQDIDYVNLHGTGTEANDCMEIASMRLVFGENQPPCGSTKPYTGHTLGAAGAVEAAICALLLQRGGTRLPAQPWIPEGRGAETGVNFSAEAARPLRHLMSNSFAFGGCNASLILSRA